MIPYGSLLSWSGLKAYFSQADDDRVLAERLELVLDSLSTAVYYNAPFTLMFGLALWFGGAAAGDLPLGHVFAAALAQAVSSFAAYLLLRRRRTLILRPHRLARMLIGLQVLIGLGWGLTAWFFWCEGSAVNNVAVGMLLFSLTWSTTTLRAADGSVLIAGVLVPALLFGLRFAASDGLAAHLFLGIEPGWLAYIFVIGRNLRCKVGAFIEMRFANADLAAELARARDEAVAQACEAEKANAAKSAFLANMSHELRTPLNAILGFSEIIAQRVLDDKPDRYAAYAQDIHDSGQHLLNLINDLLDISKIESGKMEIEPRWIEAEYVMTQVDRLMRARAEARGQDLRFGIAPGTPPLFADERSFKQIAINLVSNALKFTDDGGRVDVACGRGGDGGFLLKVADNGPGIAPEDMKKMFTPFAQVDNRYNRQTGGTGLGLSLVRGLARLHGGDAWIESTPGKGTAVFVSFPVRDAAQTGPIMAATR